jgi:hypothetical protein
MIWIPQFVDGPLAGLDPAGVEELVDYRVVDRFGEPPEVLYLERLEKSSFSYRVVEQPLRVGFIHMYRLVRVAGSMAIYQYVGQMA